jgi:hypothetical protein
MLLKKLDLPLGKKVLLGGDISGEGLFIAFAFDFAAAHRTGLLARPGENHLGSP